MRLLLAQTISDLLLHLCLHVGVIFRLPIDLVMLEHFDSLLVCHAVLNLQLGMNSHIFLRENLSTSFLVYITLLLLHRLREASDNDLQTVHIILHGGKYSQCLFASFCNFSQTLFRLNLCNDLAQHLHIHFFIFFWYFGYLTLLVTEKVEVHVDVLTGLPDHLLLSDLVKELVLREEDEPKHGFVTFGEGLDTSGSCLDAHDV